MLNFATEQIAVRILPRTGVSVTVWVFCSVVGTFKLRTKCLSFKQTARSFFLFLERFQGHNNMQRVMPLWTDI